MFLSASGVRPVGEFIMIGRGYSLFLFIFLTLNWANLYPALGNDFSPADPSWKIPIDIQAGISMISEMQKMMKDKSTTAYRRERKAVLYKDTFDDILNNLKKRKIQFHPREDFVIKDHSAGNFTFYGRAASFLNRGERMTKIRMRARIYVVYSNSTGSVERSEITRDRAFLEIKIKNPTHLEPDGVHKYRIILEDRDILKLFRADPKSPKFFELIEELKANALSLKLKQNTPEKVKAVFYAIQLLAAKDPSFIQPLFVTSYQRKSFAFTYKNYPIPYTLPRPIRSLTNLWKFWNWSDPKVGYHFKDVEFQLTQDENVQGFTAQVFPSDERLEIDRYFSPDFTGIKVAYPANSVVVELKEPAEVSQLRETFRSRVHNWLQKDMLIPMEENIIQNFLLNGRIKKNFEFNRGKAGHLSEFIADVIHEKTSAREIEDSAM